MKKISVASLLFCLMLALYFSANAVNRDYLYSAQPATSIAAADGVLYAVISNQIHAFTPSEVESRIMTGDFNPYVTVYAKADIDPSDVPIHELVGGDALYGLDMQLGLLYPMEIYEDSILLKAAIELEWQAPRRQETPRVYAAFVQEGYLYLLLMSNPAMGTRDLVRFSLQTGSKETLISSGTIKAMASYRDGSLLVALFDRAAYDTAGNPKALLPQIKVYDPAARSYTDTRCSVSGETVAGLAYDAQTDTILIATENGLFCQATDAKEMIRTAIFPTAPFQSTATGSLLESGTYVLRDDYGLYFRDPSTLFSEEQALRIAGTVYLRDEGYAAFTQKYPQTLVMFEQKNYTAEEIYLNAIGDSGPDIYCISDMTLLNDLMEKGYCLPLDDSSMLKQAENELYPYIADTLSVEGQLMAWPVELYESNLLAYNKAVLETLGLSEEALPKTLMELMDFMEKWVEEYQYIDSSIHLFASDGFVNARRALLEMILKQYAVYMEAAGNSASFDTSLLRLLLMRLDEITPLIESLGSQNRVFSDFDAARSLFICRYNLLYRDPALDMHMLPISLDSGIDPAIVSQMAVMIVNVKTLKPGSAIAYLEQMSQNPHARLQVQLYPNRNTPVESPIYNEISKNTDDPDRLYIVTPDTISTYREIASSIHLSPLAERLLTSDSFLTLLSRYEGEQINALTYIQEGNRMLRMIEMEQQ